MTYGKKQFENLDSAMRRLIPPFHQAMNELLQLVDADSSAFNSYMVGFYVTVRLRLNPHVSVRFVLRTDGLSCLWA